MSVRVNSTRKARGLSRYLNAGEVEVLLRMYEAGHTDGEIATLIGCSRAAVARQRVRRGLPTKYDAWKRANHGLAGHRAMTFKHEVSLGTWRALQQRAAVRSLGWPDDIPMRQAHILEALWRGGALTIEGLNRATQRTGRTGVRDDLSALVRLGLVLRVPGTGVRGRFAATQLYTLPLSVERTAT